MRSDVIVSDAEQQPSAYRIKRLCPAKMVPSVSATEAERTGEAERKKELFIELAGVCCPKRLVPPSPPCLRSPLSHSSLFGTERG